MNEKKISIYLATSVYLVQENVQSGGCAERKRDECVQGLSMVCEISIYMKRDGCGCCAIAALPKEYTLAFGSKQIKLKGKI